MFVCVHQPIATDGVGREYMTKGERERERERERMEPEEIEREKAATITGRRKAIESESEGKSTFNTGTIHRRHTQAQGHMGRKLAF